MIISKKVFFLGDFYRDNGPSIANRALLKCLHSKSSIIITHSNDKDIIGRVLELFHKVKDADIVCLCSSSRINYFAIILSKVFQKKCIYILHGYLRYEEQMNKMDRRHLNRYTKLERYTFKKVDKIICVSKRTMNLLQHDIPQYYNKIEYNFNYVEVEKRDHIQDDSHYVMMSIGGGMPRKANLQICKAIQLLINKGVFNNDNVRYIVVGPLMQYGNKIKSYDFVEYYEELNHKQVINKLQTTNLYIQNSLFETFCLAVVEAINCGCNILMGKNIGVIDLIQNLEETNLIQDANDIEGIANRIEKLFYTSVPLLSFNLEPEIVAERFENIINHI